MKEPGKCRYYKKSGQPPYIMTFYFSSAYQKMYLFQTVLLSGSLKEGLDYGLMCA